MKKTYIGSSYQTNYLIQITLDEYTLLGKLLVLNVYLDLYVS